MISQISIIGNLGEDATIKINKETQQSFMAFSVGVNETDKAGNKIVKWFQVTAKETKVFEYLKKGVKIHVTGKWQVTLHPQTKEIQYSLFANEITLISNKHD